MPNDGFLSLNHPVPVEINALGMKCPWPVLRAARAMRSADAIVIAADDPMAGRELTALASERGWGLRVLTENRFLISSTPDDCA